MAEAAAQRGMLGSDTAKLLNETYVPLKSTTKKENSIKTEMRGTDEESEGPQKSIIKLQKQQKTLINPMPIIPFDLKLEDSSSPYNTYTPFPVTPTTVSMMVAAANYANTENVYAGGRNFVAAAEAAAGLNNVAAVAAASHNGKLTLKLYIF